MKAHARSAVSSDRGVCVQEFFSFFPFGGTHYEKQGGLGILQLKSGSEMYRRGGVWIVIIVLAELYAFIRYRVM
jgi:hypothetical protein